MKSQKNLEHNNAQLNFIYDWLITIRIALILFCFVFIVHVLLQPFDTQQPTTLGDVLELAGYGFIVFTSYLIVHAIEL